MTISSLISSSSVSRVIVVPQPCSQLWKRLGWLKDLIAVRQPIDHQIIERRVRDCFSTFAQPRHQLLTANEVVVQILL